MSDMVDTCGACGKQVDLGDPDEDSFWKRHDDAEVRHASCHEFVEADRHEILDVARKYDVWPTNGQISDMKTPQKMSFVVVVMVRVMRHSRFLCVARNAMVGGCRDDSSVSR